MSFPGLYSLPFFIEDEQLARSAINCLENLVLLNGSRFTNGMWTMSVDLIRDIFDSTLPHS